MIRCLIQRKEFGCRMNEDPERLKVREQLVQLGAAIGSVFTSDGFTRAAEAAALSGRRIGEAGWTFPLDATFREVDEMWRRAELEGIDVVFSHFLEEPATFQKMRSRLIEGTELTFWRPLIEQSFGAYEAGLYLVVVPAMLTVFEGCLTQAGGMDAWVKTRTKELTRQLRAAAAPGSLELARWTCLEAFVSRLYASHSFEVTRPTIINRHWILHGRDAPVWDKTDCLRLFQAVDNAA
jgi:hypothetical protein